MEPRRAQELAEKLLRWIAREQSDFVAGVGGEAIPTDFAPGDDRVARLRRLLVSPLGPPNVTLPAEAG